MNEELLISIIERYPELYDTADSRYHDEFRRNKIWEEIGSMMKENPENCRVRWKRIRDNYRRAKSLRVTKSGQAAIKQKPIRYEKELAFICPYISFKNPDKLKNITSLVSDDEVQSISPPSTPTYKRKTTRNTQSNTSTQALSHIEKKFNRKESTIVDFFTNMGRTVDSFPEDIQIRVKSSIFKIVNEAEMEVFERKKNVPPAGAQQIQILAPSEKFLPTLSSGIKSESNL